MEDLAAIAAIAQRITVEDRGGSEANTARYRVKVVWADGSRTTIEEDDLASAFAALRRDHP